MRGTCSGSWFDLCLAKLSGFSFRPGSSNTTQEILMPVTSTTLLGIWQLRDWYGNTIFLSFTPNVTASAKVVTLEERWERFLLKGKKKEEEETTTLRLTRGKPPDLPCGWLPWPQVCSEHRGQWWVWEKSPNQENRRAQCDRLGQRWWWARRSSEGLFTFPNFKRY